MQFSEIYTTIGFYLASTYIVYTSKKAAPKATETDDSIWLGDLTQKKIFDAGATARRTPS